MSDDAQEKQSRIKELIARGKEQGYLTYAEVNDHLPEDISDPDQVEDIIQMINDMGIRVYETAPDPTPHIPRVKANSTRIVRAGFAFRSFSDFFHAGLMRHSANRPQWSRRRV